MIYVSTGGIPNQSACETSKNFLKDGISCIELSGGQFSSNMLTELKELKSKAFFQIHNYFPPPEVPFVFNLASLSPEKSKKSLDHACSAIQWVTELETRIYSFHGGFLLDPQINELGKRIGKYSLYDREEAMSHFINNVKYLSVKARKAGVSLLIENNVLSYENYKEYGTDPLLMTTPEECVYVMKNTPDNVNMLVDVAHLKVSANSLGYNPADMFHLCAPWIKAYHLSDNNSLSDSNNPFDEHAWFWPFIKHDLEYYSIEVYNISTKELIKLIDIVKNNLNHAQKDNN